MDAASFDRLTRSLSAAVSRRGLLAGLTTVLGLAAISLPRAVEAKKKRKKKLKKNEFGCVDVGKACRGKDANCCSNICQGKKPKKGKKDKSKCVAHNVLDCVLGVDVCSEGVEVFCGNGSVCLPTTGKAVFCGGAFPNCDPPSCTKDVECEASRGPGAACVACPGVCGTGTTCVNAGT